MKKENKQLKGDRVIRLPLAQEEYTFFITDRFFAKKEIDRLYKKHPELFPSDFSSGYVLNGFTDYSVKQGYRHRRIRLNVGKVTFTIAPAFLMPYMTALTKDVEKALFLRRFNIPYWGLTYAFGHDDMFRYRREQAPGRFSIVGTTVKSREKLPKDLSADEKHTYRRGEKH